MEFISPPRLVTLKFLRDREDDAVILGLVVELLVERNEESSEVKASRSCYVRRVKQGSEGAKAIAAKLAGKCEPRHSTITYLHKVAMRAASVSSGRRTYGRA